MSMYSNILFMKEDLDAKLYAEYLHRTFDGSTPQKFEVLDLLGYEVIHDEVLHYSRVFNIPIITFDEDGYFIQLELEDMRELLRRMKNEAKSLIGEGKYEEVNVKALRLFQDAIGMIGDYTHIYYEWDY